MFTTGRISGGPAAWMPTSPRIGINLVFSFAVPGISIGGHIGGLIGGALAAVVLFELPDRVRRLPPLAPMIAAGALGAAAVVGSLAVV